MRRIETREEIELRQKKKNRMLSMFMLIILVGSTVGFAFLYRTDSGQVDSVNGQNVGNGWAYKVGDQTLVFSVPPESIGNVSVNIYSNLNSYYNSILYIDSDNQAVINEVANTLGRYTGKMQLACYGECSEDLPEKDCTNNIIVWKGSNFNKVYQEDKCIFIEGDLRAVDAFLFEIFGIDY